MAKNTCSNQSITTEPKHSAYDEMFNEMYKDYTPDCDDYEDCESYGPSNPWDAPGMSISDFCDFPVCPF